MRDPRTGGTPTLVFPGKTALSSYKVPAEHRVRVRHLAGYAWPDTEKQPRPLPTEAPSHRYSGWEREAVTEVLKGEPGHGRTAFLGGPTHPGVYPAPQRQAELGPGARWPMAEARLPNPCCSNLGQVTWSHCLSFLIHKMGPKVTTLHGAAVRQARDYVCEEVVQYLVHVNC